MTCERCRPLLSLYHDGLLSGARAAEGEAVRAHLIGCPACTAVLAAYRQNDVRITAALAVPASPRLRAAVLAATVQRRGEERRLGERPRRKRGQVLFGGLAGATVAALAVLLLALAGNLWAPSGRHARQVAAPAKNQATALAWVAGVQSGTEPSPLPRALGLVPALPTVAHRHLVPAQPTIQPIGPLVAASSTTIAPLDRAATLRIAPDAVLSDGGIRGPLWSPDSSSLLYLTDWKTDQATTWFAGTLMRYSPSGTIQLATQVRDFDWSPDGRFVAYTTENSDPGGALTDALGAARLHVVSADGTGDRLLTGVDHANVEWFANGIIAIRHGRPVRIDPSTGQATPLSGLPSVTIADEQTAFYAVSANQRFFAYQDGTGLRVWDRDRGGAMVISQPHSRYMEAGFHFSWDGTILFYSVFDGTNTMLYRQSLDPLGQAVPLNNGLPLHGPIDLVGPTSADGAIVSFRTGTGAATHNYVIDALAGRAHQLLPPGGVGPVGWWSPDGRHLVYVLYQGDTAIRAGVAQVSR